MKTIAIHSHKGGVGKTTLALLLAKCASIDRRVCVLDYDFIGSGLANLFALETFPKSYLEQYFTDAEPHQFQLAKLLASYKDRDMANRDFSVVLRQGKGLPKSQAAQRQQESEIMTGLVANEPHYHEIEKKTTILLSLLEKAGFALAVFDCHPGLGLVSETMIALADLNLYVTTLNRGDCFGLLKTINLKQFDQPSAFLLVNKAEPAVGGLETFRSAMQNDGLVGMESTYLLEQFKFIGKDEKRFGLIPDSETLRLVFQLGGKGQLPRVDAEAPSSGVCGKVLALLP